MANPSVWCAQHDHVSFLPSAARSYELPSFSGAESARILRLLMKIKDPSTEVTRAIHAGVAWYRAATLNGIRLRQEGE